MSAAESEAAVKRLSDIREQLGVEAFASYAFLAIGLLAYSTPEVANYVMDRADEKSGPR